MHTPPLGIPETQPLKIPNAPSRQRGGYTRYGSILGTPPKDDSPADAQLNKGPPSLNLPDPVFDPDDEGFSRRHKPWEAGTPAQIEPPKQAGRDAFEVGETRHPHTISSRLMLKNRNLFQPRRINSTPGPVAAGPPRTRLFKRMISGLNDSPQSNDVPLEAYRELDVKQEEFFNFLDKELEKIESFYKMKEKEANERLQVLRDQLHEMRDRRMEEVIEAQRAKHKSKNDDEGQLSPGPPKNGEPVNGHNKGPNWFKPVEGVLTNKHHFGKNTKAMGQLGTPPGLNGTEGADIADRRDFVRRLEHHQIVPYRLAKRKLKIALQEYYRGLELLKSYALLNRTAFRKINKKYDKAVNARPTGRYMSEKVNKAWFVQSEVIEGHIVTVEDLYSRYFERGNHKIAVGKLRSKGLRSGDFSPIAFRNGLLLAAGLVLAIQGLVYASQRLRDPDPNVHGKTSYLLQVCGPQVLLHNDL
jgi:xenotropic and polytropic retrovirus receptor 1